MAPFQRVLVAVDFSEGSRVALSYAKRLANQCDAQLDILHVVEPCLAAAAGEPLFEEVRQELRQLVDGLTPKLRHSPSFHVVEGNPSDAIVNIAHRERAGVVVLGTRGLSNIGWPGLGGTLEDVIRRTRTSLLTVPGTWSPPRSSDDDLAGCGPVIAGVNMTCPSLDGAVVACRLASTLNTSAILLHAVPTPQAPPRWHALACAAASRQFEQSRQDLELVTTTIREESQAPTTLTIESGDVTQVIVQAARQHPGGLVVLGRGTVPHPFGSPGSIVARAAVLGGVPVFMYLTDGYSHDEAFETLPAA